MTCMYMHMHMLFQHEGVVIVRAESEAVDAMPRYGVDDDGDDVSMHISFIIPSKPNAMHHALSKLGYFYAIIRGGIYVD